MAEASAQYWLVKMPPWLADEMEKGGDRAAGVLAELQTEVVKNKRKRGGGGGADDEETTLQMRFKLKTEKNDVPTDLEMEEATTGANVHLPIVFKQARTDKDGNAECVVVDEVTKQYNLKPVMNEKYEDFMLERHAKSNKNELTTKRLQDKGKIKLGALMRHSQIQRSKLVFKRDSEARKTRRYRMDRQELLGELLRLFEKQDAYSTKELQNITDQPMDYLKQTLREVAQYQLDGTHAKRWVLKDSHKLKSS